MIENEKNKYIKKLLNKSVDEIGQLDNYRAIVNNGTPFFEENDLKTIEGIPKYFEPDELGRARGAMAIISRNTLSIRTEKHLRYPDPHGWNKLIEDSGIFQRCHAVAYRLSAKKNNKDNIFIGTDYLNRTIMGEVERDIEKDIRENEKQYIKILYRVTPLYKEKNQIPTGVLIEAKGLNTEYNKCIFCYNINKKVTFDYYDGTIITDNRMISKNKLVQNVKKLYEKSMQQRSKNGNINLVIDNKSKVYHTENCIIPNKINPKYIKEITTKEKIIKDEGYTKCKECF